MYLLEPMSAEPTSSLYESVEQPLQKRRLVCLLRLGPILSS